MGDFENTFGAGRDAADIIDAYSWTPPTTKRNTDNPKWPRPEGMPDIDYELFCDLNIAVEEMNHLWGHEPGEMMTDWEVLVLTALKPETEQEVTRIAPGCEDTRYVVSLTKAANEKQAALDAKIAAETAARAERDRISDVWERDNAD
ncbi:hypothetical protein ELG77_08915 [Rhizobium leguminosarum]|uniref:hypothetical protein n=1 Tax=Rhizobium leguminosarum TaxID=384 RepID=UPI00102F4E12|nr:hypothetical protein [Rhizobium leguminosarum]TBG41882.1 hypothetical protein ELG77_08915 [Rhizobium leguminosarum]